MSEDWIAKKISYLENEMQELKSLNAELELRIFRLEQNNPNFKKSNNDLQSLGYHFNCWEFKKCGREPDGLKVSELGVCPAAAEKKYTGLNKGKRGGRVCWAIVGTLCGGRVQGVFAEKVTNCINCDFYNYVEMQEGQDFRHTLRIKS